MNLSKLIAVLLCFVVSSFAFGAMSERDKKIIIEQITQLKEEVCECKIDATKIKSLRIEEIEKVWSPLIESNRKIFESFVETLPEIVELNKLFTKTNDPRFIGFSMYFLRVFAEIAAEAGKVITGKDLNQIITILESSYQLEIPKVVKGIIKDIKAIKIHNLNNGVQQLVLETTTKRAISIDLTHPDLMGKQEGKKHIIKTIKIEHKSSMLFTNDQVSFSRCKIGRDVLTNCHMAEVGQEFFSNRSNLTKEYQTISDKVTDYAMDYFQDKKFKEVSASPLYIKFKGIYITGDFNGFSGIEPRFEDAMVIPGVDELPAFYIRVNIKAFLGLVEKNMELAL